MVLELNPTSNLYRTHRDIDCGAFDSGRELERLR